MMSQPAPFDNLVADLTTQRAGIRSVEVGAGLLTVLGNAAGALMLRDLAALAGMRAAKAHRYLVSFQRQSLVIQDPSKARYDLAPAALKPGLASLSGIDAVKLARAQLGFLMAQIGQTLAVCGNPGPCRVYREESPPAFAPRCLTRTATWCWPWWRWARSAHLMPIGRARVAPPLKAAAQQLSSDLGYIA